jgi:hypothetical protein
MCAVGVLSFLAGCGGGGGGSDAAGGSSATPTGTAPQPSAGVATAALTVAKSAAIAKTVTGYPELILSLAQTAAERVRSLVQADGVASQSGCGAPVEQVSLEDLDADGRPSAGDRVRIEYAPQCTLWLSGRIVTGALVVSLSVTPTRGGTIAGTVSAPQALKLGDLQGGTAWLSGSFSFEYTMSDSAYVVRVNPSAADDLKLESGTVGSGQVEAIRAPAFSKSVDFVNAHSTVSLAYRLDSTTLAGTVLVTTPGLLDGHVETKPSSGLIAVQGGGSSKLTIAPAAIDRTGLASVNVDENGDGKADGSTLVDWLDMHRGFLWWSGLSTVVAGSSRPFDIRAELPEEFGLLSSPQARTTGVRPQLIVQFSRLLDASTKPAYRFRKWDRYAYTYTDTPDQAIAATVDVQGAQIVVSPVAQLEHGQTYRTELLNGDATNGYEKLVNDVSGNTVRMGFLQIDTLDSLAATIATPDGLALENGKSLRLDASASRSSGAAIAAYQWRQISGPTLAISGASLAQASVALAAPVVGVLPIELELTVTDANGEFDRTRVRIQAIDDQKLHKLIYYRSPPGESLGKGGSDLRTDAAGYFQSGADDTHVGIHFVSTAGDYVSYEFSAYVSALPALGVGQRSDAALTFSMNGLVCLYRPGVLNIIELDRDAMGTINKIAVDFDFACDLGLPVFQGSIRLNSAVPLRP